MWDCSPNVVLVDEEDDATRVALRVEVLDDPLEVLRLGVAHDLLAHGHADVVLGGQRHEARYSLRHKAYKYTHKPRHTHTRIKKHKRYFWDGTLYISVISGTYIESKL